MPTTLETKIYGKISETLRLKKITPGAHSIPVESTHKPDVVYAPGTVLTSRKTQFGYKTQDSSTPGYKDLVKGPGGSIELEMLDYDQDVVLLAYNYNQVTGVECVLVLKIETGSVLFFDGVDFALDFKVQ